MKNTHNLKWVNIITLVVVMLFITVLIFAQFIPHSFLQGKYDLGSHSFNNDMEIVKEVDLSVANTYRVALVFNESEIIGTFTPLLYMYGVKALSAEEVALGERGQMTRDLPYGEEHFIVGLPEILFEIDQLKKLKIDYSKIKIASVDEYALTPINPVKPKKILVLLLAGVFGVFLGVMVALIVSAYQRHDRR